MNNFMDKLKCGLTAVRYIPKKSDMENSITSSFNIDIKDDYIIQGITNINNNLFITAYSEDKTKKSKLFIYNDNKLLKNINLYNNAHVGGICYDDIHNIIWITDKAGSISGYNYNDLMLGKIEPLYKRIYVGDDLQNVYGFNACAYIQYFNNKIYVGNYNQQNKSILKEYTLLEDGNINVNNFRVINFIDYVQGICFYKKEDKIYLLVSSSVGRYSKSKISVFEFNNINSYRIIKPKTIYLPPMLEQITILNSNLVLAFESNANKYKMRNSKTNDITFIDINKII